MKSKLRQVMQYISSKKSSRKNFILSVVALVEVLAILVVSTYAWVESASTIIIQSDGDQPIDTFVYTNAVLDSTSAAGAIDLSNYFRASGNMHISSARSLNGADIYFPRVQASTGSLSGNLFRSGTVSDKNTNYISFSVKVEANDEVNLVFDTVPTFTINGQKVTDSSVRLAVSDGTSTKIFSMTSVAAQNVDLNGVLSTANAVEAFAEYSSSTATKKVLEIPAGENRTVTFTLWLEDPDRTKAVDINISDLRLVALGSTSTSVYFLDKTSRYNAVDDTSTVNGWGWTDNGGNTMWVSDEASGNIRKMNASTDANGYTRWAGGVTRSSIESNSKLVFYNCAASVSMENVKTNYICKWETTFSDLSTQNPTYRTYTAYGNKNASNVGYGTWNPSVDLITLDVDDWTVPAKPTTLTDSANVYLTDSSGNRLEMYYQNVGGTYCWRTFAPNDTASNIFHFTENNNTYNITAYGRNTNQSESTFKITSTSGSGTNCTGTGYWVPPATVKVVLGNDSYVSGSHTPMGTVSVSGGAPNSSTVKVTAKSSVILHANASGDYGFAGWYNDPQCSGDPVYTSANQTVTAPGENEEKTYYAKFLPVYTITLHSISDDLPEDSTTGGTVQINTGAAGKTATLKVLQGSSVTIKANANASHNFLGWFADNNWSNTTAISGITGTQPTIANIQEDKIYYARFKIKQFKIEAQAKHDTLDSDTLIGDETDTTGGTVEFTNPVATPKAHVEVTVNYNGSATFKANPTSSYEFKGWFDNENCTGTAVSPDNPYTKNNITDNDKLYAKFTLKKYAATAHAVNNTTVNNSTYGEVCVVTNSTEGTYGATASNTIKHGGTIMFRAKVKTHGRFIGWYSDSACTKQITGTAVTNSGRDLTLTITSKTDVYAKFMPITYTVTANATPSDYGTVQVNSAAKGSTSKDTGVVEGSSVTLTAYPAQNKQFVGWYTNSACTVSAGTASGENNSLTISNITADKTYYAKFETITDRIIYFYDANGNYSSSSKPTIWYWTDGGAENAKNDGYTWSGPQMTIVPGYTNVWSYTLSGNSTYSNRFQFGGGDTTYPSNNSQNMYNNKTASWSAFPPTGRTVTVNYNSNASSIKVNDNVTTITATTSNQSGTINSGKTITLTAAVKSGYEFVSFTIKNASGTELQTITTNGGTYTVPDSNISITTNIKKKANLKTFYFENTLDWNNFKVYLFKGSSDAGARWPGETPTYAGRNTFNTHDIYSLEVNLDNVTGFVINGSGGQTVNVYVNSTGNPDDPYFGDNNACHISSVKDGNNFKIGGFWTK